MVGNRRVRPPLKNPESKRAELKLYRWQPYCCGLYRSPLCDEIGVSPSSGYIGNSAGEAMDSEQWKQLDKLLEAALARLPEQRDAFLREACVGDERLEREARSLLTL